MKYRREAPFAALGRATNLNNRRLWRYALRDVRRVLWYSPKSRRRVNGRLVRLEVRP